MFELVEETLNEIAFAVEGEIARARGFSVGFGWDDWRDRSSVEGADEGVGVEGLVGDQSAGIDGFDQRFGTSQIVILARAEHRLDGIAKGIDERVIRARAIAELSLGDFVLSGGEPAAMALIDACVRLLPGVIGDEAALAEESFTRGLLEYPHYTRPQTWQGLSVPDVLLSGHHEQIRNWRLEQSRRRAKRPLP